MDDPLKSTAGLITALEKIGNAWVAIVLTFVGVCATVIQLEVPFIIQTFNLNNFVTNPQFEPYKTYGLITFMVLGGASATILILQILRGILRGFIWLLIRIFPKLQNIPVLQNQGFGPSTVRFDSEQDFVDNFIEQIAKAKGDVWYTAFNNIMSSLINTADPELITAINKKFKEEPDFHYRGFETAYSLSVLRNIVKRLLHFEGKKFFIFCSLSHQMPEETEVQNEETGEQPSVIKSLYTLPRAPFMAIDVYAIGNLSHLYYGDYHFDNSEKRPVILSTKLRGRSGKVVSKFYQEYFNNLRNQAAPEDRNATDHRLHELTDSDELKLNEKKVLEIAEKVFGASSDKAKSWLEDIRNEVETEKNIKGKSQN